MPKHGEMICGRFREILGNHPIVWDDAAPAKYFPLPIGDNPTGNVTPGKWFHVPMDEHVQPSTRGRFFAVPTTPATNGPNVYFQIPNDTEGK